MKPVIIGQAPNRTGDPSEPLNGNAGRKLARLLGISQDVYLRRFDRFNVFDEWPGRKGKGDVFDEEKARIVADQMRRFELRSRPFVIFLGRSVAKAFGHRSDYFEWSLLDHRTLSVMLPHPSGINRWWNDPMNLRRGRKVLRIVLDGERIRVR